MPRTSSLFAALALAASALSACSSPDVDLQKALQVTDVTTGWFDAGIVEGNKNKLVPSISIKLKNLDRQAVDSVQLLAKFGRQGEPEEWGSAPYVKAIGTDGLPAGQATPAIVIRCDRGYTGEQPRLQMLQHREFVDAKVEIFGKHRAQDWVKLGEYRIARQLLTR